MTIKRILELATKYNWEFLGEQKDNYMLSFYKEGMRINVWYTKMTVATCLRHPKWGKTQLFRKLVSNPLMEEIFKNPRTHTDKGYYIK